MEPDQLEKDLKRGDVDVPVYIQQQGYYEGSPGTSELLPQ